jgi:hypothetical protein
MKNLKRIIKKYKLDGLTIRLVNKSHKELDGTFSPFGFSITVYMKNDEPYETLLHELTHAILYRKSKGKSYLNHNEKFYKLLSQLV